MKTKQTKYDTVDDIFVKGSYQHRFEKETLSTFTKTLLVLLIAGVLVGGFFAWSKGIVLEL